MNVFQSSASQAGTAAARSRLDRSTALLTRMSDAAELIQGALEEGLGLGFDGHIRRRLKRDPPACGVLGDGMNLCRCPRVDDHRCALAGKAQDDALPMPLPEPVTMATLSCSNIRFCLRYHSG